MYFTKIWGLVVYSTACTAWPFIWDEKHFTVSLELPQKLLQKLLQEASVVYTLFSMQWRISLFCSLCIGSDPVFIIMDQHVFHAHLKWFFQLSLLWKKSSLHGQRHFAFKTKMSNFGMNTELVLKQTSKQNKKGKLNLHPFLQTIILQACSRSTETVNRRKTE